MLAAIVPAERSHIDAIASSPRPADVAELWAVARATPRVCMERGLEVSTRAYTGLLDGEPACMFGLTPVSILAGWGAPWMVGSTKLEKLSAQKAMLRASAAGMDYMKRQCSLLFNVVDDRNTSAQRWLLWLGFTLLEPEPMGFNGERFRTFYWQG